MMPNCARMRGKSNIIWLIALLAAIAVASSITTDKPPAPITSPTPAEQTASASENSLFFGLSLADVIETLTPFKLPTGALQPHNAKPDPKPARLSDI